MTVNDMQIIHSPSGDELVGMRTVEERHRMTLEALADVDAGRVTDHTAVQAWADSLLIRHRTS